MEMGVTKQKACYAIGHENGTKAVRTTVESCVKLGVENLTLYAFSMKTGTDQN